MRPSRIAALIWALIVACTAASPASFVAPVTGCAARPSPRPTTGRTDAVEPTGEWTERAGIVLSMLGDAPERPGAVSDAIVVVELWPIGDVAAKRSVLDALREARATLLPELRASVDAFRAGDQGGRCRASAAARSIVVALRGAALTLARVLHWDVGQSLEFGIGAAAQVADELNPSCVPDAGWSTLGNETRDSMRSRGRLRAFPTEAEAREAARTVGR